MKKLLLMGVLALSLAGCTGMSTSIGPLKVDFTSNPIASALRTCAMFAELLTPGINIAAAAELARGMQDNVLGNTPQGAMRNCAKMMDFVAD